MLDVSYFNFYKNSQYINKKSPGVAVESSTPFLLFYESD